MKKTNFAAALALCFVLLAAQGSLARTVYVTDSFEITMRTGGSTQNKVIAMLPSDTPLTVLSEQNGWLRVRTSDGREGWVLERYTQADQPKSVQIERLTERNEKLTALTGGAAEQLNALEEENGALKEELARTQQELEQVSRKYDALRADAAEVITLKNDYAQTNQKLQSATMQAAALRQENEALKSSANLKWFLSGAGVVFAAWLFGFIMGRIQRRKRSTLQF